MRRLLPWLGVVAIALAAWWLWPAGGGTSRTALSAVALAAALPAIDPARPNDNGLRRLAPAAADWRPALPQDLGPHTDQRSELWDLHGVLQDDKGRRLGFRLTLVRLALRGPDTARPSELAADALLLGRFALSPASGESVHAERASRMAAGLAGTTPAPPAVWLEDWQLRLPAGDAADADGRLEVRVGELNLALSLTARKPAIAPAAALLDGAPGARDTQADDAAVRVFSLPRLAVAGQLERDGDSQQVRGTAWLDRAWGGAAAAGGGALAGTRGQLALNRFLLQLDDDSELLCIQLRRRAGGGTPVPSCIVHAADGSIRPLRRRELSLTPGDRLWRSDASNAQYPLHWRLQVPTLGLDLSIDALTSAQELLLGEPLWSGAVALAGTRDGQTVAGGGRMDLSGYAE
jgi:predicted secreted hydrolase